QRLGAGVLAAGRDLATGGGRRGGLGPPCEAGHQQRRDHTENQPGAHHLKRTRCPISGVTRASPGCLAPLSHSRVAVEGWGAHTLTAMSERPAWHTDDFPELRDAPPWVMQEMIESQPELLERVATTTDTAPLALMLQGPGPFSVVGCGTSEHASLAAAAILTE